MAKYRGQCLCGAVQFEVEGPTNWCAHCHCTMCQQGHGAAFVTWFGAVRSRFAVVAGQESLGWYESSSHARRGFCRTCGSSLFFDSTRWPDEIHIVRANVDGDIDRQPQAHVFFDTHVDWYAVGDDLEKKP